MSLSSHLDDRTSPIGQFIKQRFAQTAQLTKQANQQLKSAETIRPAQADRSYPYTVIGTAIDYRLRYAFDITPYRKLVAWQGATLLTIKPLESAEDIPLELIDAMGIPARFDRAAGIAQGPYTLSLIQSFFNSLETMLNTIQPKGRRLDGDAERILDRYCIVLCFFEQVFRSYSHQQGPLMQPTVKHSVEALLAIPQAAWIDDLSELFRLFYDRYHQLLSLPRILNPTFAGSVAIGGADADMIVDGCLIDIKTSISPQIKAEYLYQLAGYLLLDYDDQRCIDSVGIYMARQGMLFQWPVSEFLPTVTGDPQISLSALRQAFRTLCQGK